MINREFSCLHHKHPLAYRINIVRESGCHMLLARPWSNSTAPNFSAESIDYSQSTESLVREIPKCISALSIHLGAMGDIELDASTLKCTKSCGQRGEPLGATVDKQSRKTAGARSKLSPMLTEKRSSACWAAT